MLQGDFQPGIETRDGPNYQKLPAAQGVRGARTTPSCSFKETAQKLLTTPTPRRTRDSNPKPTPSHQKKLGGGGGGSRKTTQGLTQTEAEEEEPKARRVGLRETCAKGHTLLGRPPRRVVDGVVEGHRHLGGF